METSKVIQDIDVGCAEQVTVAVIVNTCRLLGTNNINEQNDEQIDASCKPLALEL